MINVSQLVSLIYAYIKLTCVFVYYLATSTMLGTRAQQVPPSADESTQLLPEGPTSSIFVGKNGVVDEFLVSRAFGVPKAGA